MRVAAVALVLVVGAAVVLGFANTLNSWVLGGLLGGLAAILLSIPISLTLFTLLARRHEIRQQGTDAAFALEEPYDEEQPYARLVRYQDAALQEEDTYPRQRQSRRPVSGYLPLPPADRDVDAYEDEMQEPARYEPHNYPRQPRAPGRLQPGESEGRQPGRSYRNPSTHSLAQHQAQARRQARLEALQRSSRRSSASDRSPHRAHTPPALHTRASGQMRSSGSTRRPSGDADDSRFPEQRGTHAPWGEGREVTEDFSTGPVRSQAFSRRRDYRPTPRASRPGDRWTTGRLHREQEEMGERRSGNLRNPLVRRAPYLYEDDPLRQQFARQLRHEPPQTRRSSRLQASEDEEEEY
jgi:hypothetical protein